HEVFTMRRSLTRWMTPLALGVIPAVFLIARFNPMAVAKGSGDQNQASAQPANQLTDEEKKAGWILLFDGKSFDGWHNFKSDGVRPGWQVKDGTLACVDPKHAGDIVTTGKYDWYELSI